MTYAQFKIPLFTAFALMAFAANSVLNRLALGGNMIDAGSYITLRLVSGAVTLWLINAVSKRKIGWLRGHHFLDSLVSAFYLFLYGVCFSFAYRSLTSGTGAFILFGTVQTTMLAVLLSRGEKPHISEWVSLLIALGGLGYIVFPGLSAPDPLGAFLMVAAGMAWALYTLRGKGVKDPLETSATNFIFSVPMIFCIYCLNLTKTHVNTEGVAYAVASGALASGVGYVIWYAALRGLTTTQAALLQLSVPVIAAFGGIIFLSETLTTRLIIGGVLIIFGVSLALLGKPKSTST
jgi:drug/metabolite transporter (DMT)-like permease